MSAIGTSFGGIHSARNLHLIQQKIEIAPAKPRTNYITVPGRNGSIDLTEAYGLGVIYDDRELTWTFALYPGDDWFTRHSEVSDLINGKAVNIVIDGDPDWYYEGRTAVDSYKTDGLLRQITVKAICRPYKLSRSMTQQSAAISWGSFAMIYCDIGKMPLVPTITVDKDAQVKWGGETYTIDAGQTTIPALRMSGRQEIQVKTLLSGESGTASISWREGKL